MALQIYPGQQMMQDAPKLFKELKRVEVFDSRKTGGWTEEEVARLAMQELGEIGSVLLIVNTKKAAINLFKQLENHIQAKLFHLSTNMCAAHRMENIAKIKKCLTNNEPIVCVSTQLIEAGVDIDFGTVIRYLAGLDSIAQAAGRCNRHGVRTNKGRVFVVNPRDENLDKLKDIKIGRDVTDRLLGDYKNSPDQFDEDILSLKAMESYYQYYFHGQTEKMCYPVNKNSIIGREDNLLELLSQNSLSVAEYRRKNNNSPPGIPLRQAFMSAAKAFQAIDSPSRGIIVPYGDIGKNIINDLCSAKYIQQQYRLLKEAQRFSINVFPNVLDELIRQKAIQEVQKDSGVFYLDEHYYSEEFGMSTSKEKNMEFLST
jgi:CRISPR-associated endonuclease/helicase Cas3